MADYAAMLPNMLFGEALRSVYKELHADRETGC